MDILGKGTLQFLGRLFPFKCCRRNWKYLRFSSYEWNTANFYLLQLMDSRANTNGGGTGGTTIIPGNPNSSGISSPGGRTKRTVRVKCNFCNGTGISWSEKVYSPNYTGSDERQWCNRCNSWGIPHTHIDHRCTVCKNGYIEKEE